MPGKSNYNTEISDSFAPGEIINQSKRILAHPLFRNSPTLSRFLEFIISEVILNHEQQIKEYSIAINVLNRPPDFKSHEDAIVRIHAGRLRRALSEYYFTHGINDPIIVYIPKGSYMPHFCRSKEEKALTAQPLLRISNESSAHPIVAVFPFRIISPQIEIGEFSLELVEQITGEFCRLPGISLIGYYSTDMKSRIEENIMDAGKTIGAHFILTGTIRQMDHQIRIRINLLEAQTGRILMSKYFVEEMTNLTKPDFINHLARDLMSQVSFQESHHTFG